MLYVRHRESPPGESMYMWKLSGRTEALFNILVVNNLHTHFLNPWDEGCTFLRNVAKY